MEETTADKLVAVTFHYGTTLFMSSDSLSDFLATVRWCAACEVYPDGYSQPSAWLVGPEELPGIVLPNKVEYFATKEEWHARVKEINEANLRR